MLTDIEGKVSPRSSICIEVVVSLHFLQGRFLLNAF